MKTRINTSFIQWSIRDSNPWPPQCECGALPAALIPHNGNNGARTHDLPLVRRALSQLSYASMFRRLLYHSPPGMYSLNSRKPLSCSRRALSFRDSTAVPPQPAYAAPDAGPPPLLWGSGTVRYYHKDH